MSRRKPVDERAQYRPDRDHRESVPAGTPQAPAWLSLGARAHWDRLIPRLRALGLLTVHDGELLAVLCGALDDYETASRHLDANGATLATAGGWKASPYIAVKRDARAAVLDLSRRFGLTPRDRAELDTGKADPLAPLDGWQEPQADEKPRTATPEERDETIKSILRGVEKRTRRAKGTTR